MTATSKPANMHFRRQAAFVMMLLSAGAAVAEIAPLDSKDSILGEAQANAPATGYYPGANKTLAGTTGSGAALERENRNIVLGFSLPTLPPGTTVTNAWLEYEITGARDQSDSDPSLDVYLLNTNSPDASGTDFFYHGPSDPATDVEFVGNTYRAAGTASTNYTDDAENDHVLGITGDAMTLLQSFYGGDHIPDQTEVFLRFNLSANATLTDLDRYYIDLGSDAPVLQISGVAIQTGSASSKDYIVGEREAAAPKALGYYASASSTIGVSGAGGARDDRNVVLGFTLPTLPSGTTVSNAMFEFEIEKARNNSGSSPSLDVYLLTTNSPDSSGTTLFYHGPSDPATDTEFIGRAHIDVGTTEVTFADDLYDRTFEITGDALAQLQAFYGGDNTPDQAEAYFRFSLTVNPDETDGNSYDRYRIDLSSDESGLHITPTYPPPAGTIFHFM